jgi:hypothetical protein
MLRRLLPGAAIPASVCSCSFFRTKQLACDRVFYYCLREELATEAHGGGGGEESARGGGGCCGWNSAGIRLCEATEREFIQSHFATKLLSITTNNLTPPRASSHRLSLLLFARNRRKAPPPPAGLEKALASALYCVDADCNGLISLRSRQIFHTFELG